MCDVAMATNVVLLTIDSLRADHAADSELMPTLNEYAGTGVRFTDAHANGYSTPVSFPTILTGTYASHYGGDGFMTDERPFLARVFDRAGYDTAGFHTNPHLRAEKNYNVGFDSYNDFEDEAGELSRLRYLITQNLDSDSKLYKLLKRIYHLFRTSSGSRDYTPAPALNQRALTWLDSRRNEKTPFFLWTHYMDVHYPFYPPDQFLNKDISQSRAVSINGRMHEDDAKLTDDEIADLRALYRGEVRYMDHHLGELVEEVRDRRLDEDTVFVVTSDHGELFGEHGLFGHPPAGYDENFHVPLVVFEAGATEGVKISETVSLVDLPPTLADLAGMDIETAWEGLSLGPAVRSEGIESRDLFLGDKDVLAYQSEGWRLVWWRTQDHPRDPDREWELLRVDEPESVPLADHQSRVSEYRSRMEAFLDRAEADNYLEEPEVDESTEERLEALGYK